MWTALYWSWNTRKLVLKMPLHLNAQPGMSLQIGMNVKTECLCTEADVCVSCPNSHVNTLMVLMRNSGTGLGLGEAGTAWLDRRIWDDWQSPVKRHASLRKPSLNISQLFHALARNRLAQDLVTAHTCSGLIRAQSPLFSYMCSAASVLHLLHLCRSISNTCTWVFCLHRLTLNLLAIAFPQCHRLQHVWEVFLHFPPSSLLHFWAGQEQYDIHTSYIIISKPWFLLFGGKKTVVLYKKE